MKRFSLLVTGNTMGLIHIKYNTSIISFWLFLSFHLYPSTGFALAPEQITKITLSDRNTNTRFGSSISIHESFAIVGAPQDDEFGTNAGAAYVYRFVESEWVQEAKLLGHDIQAHDQFGISVSIRGDTALIGAWRHDGQGEDAGSVYVFKNRDTGWVETTKLSASDAKPFAHFGVSISMHNNLAVIGASGDNSFQGAAYLFRHEEEQWTEIEKLTANDGSAYEEFGNSVDLHENKAIIGAWLDDEGAGAAYMFHPQNQQWKQQGKLTSQQRHPNDQFGISVALDHHTALVGCWGDDDPSIDAGSAYLFQEHNSTWQFESKLTANNAGLYDGFGYSVALQDNIAMVGAPHSQDSMFESGAIYVFQKQNQNWSEQTKLSADHSYPNSNLGGKISMDGENALFWSPSSKGKNSKQSALYGFAMRFREFFVDFNRFSTDQNITEIPIAAGNLTLYGSDVIFNDPIGNLTIISPGHPNGYLTNDNTFNGMLDGNGFHHSHDGNIHFEFREKPVTIGFFSIEMYDYGDTFDLDTNDPVVHKVELIARDENGNPLDRDVLRFESRYNAVINARTTREYGRLDRWGDAGNLSEPGFYRFQVSGQGIKKVEIRFDGLVSVDSGIGFDNIHYRLDDTSPMPNEFGNTAIHHFWLYD